MASLLLTNLNLLHMLLSLFRWHKSWWGNRNAYDFLMEAEARMDGEWAYMKVLRLRWLGCALGETKCDIFAPSGFWNALAAMQQKALAMHFLSSKERAAVGRNSSYSWLERAGGPAAISCDHSGQAFRSNGIIFIPVEQCMKTRGSGQKVLIFRSFDRVSDSVMQMHQKADGKFEFDIDIPSSGEYMFSARVVTVHSEQQPLRILIIGNGCAAGAEYSIDVPYTGGKWEMTSPVKVTLLRGRHRFNFSRDTDSLGISIRYFQLVPTFSS